MPFKSAAQRRYLYDKLPDVAEKFEKDSLPGAKLPEHIVGLSGFEKMVKREPKPNRARKGRR
jgi:hypothetical protein